MSRQNNIAPLTINIPQSENVIHTVLPDTQYDPEPENYNEHPAVSSNQNSPAAHFAENQPMSIPIVTIHPTHVQIHNRYLNQSFNTRNYTNN